MDGQPLNETAIRFVPVEAERRMATAEIHDGQYSILAADGLLPGQYRVEFVDLPPMVHDESKLEGRLPVPEHYSRKARIFVTVGPETVQGGKAHFDFLELTTDPAAEPRQ